MEFANVEEYRKELLSLFPVNFETSEFENEDVKSPEFKKKIGEKVIAAFHQKLNIQKSNLKTFRTDLADEIKIEGVFIEVVRNMMVRKIDQLWQEHLLSIDHLRSDIQMRTVGQKDPLLEFKHESFALFEVFFKRLREEITRDLFRFEMMPPQEKRTIGKKLPFGGPSLLEKTQK